MQSRAGYRLAAWTKCEAASARAYLCVCMFVGCLFLAPRLALALELLRQCLVVCLQLLHPGIGCSQARLCCCQFLLQLLVQALLCGCCIFYSLQLGPDSSKLSIRSLLGCLALLVLSLHGRQL